jgi:branched-chain amino acid transport system substrate-binding protein
MRTPPASVFSKRLLLAGFAALSILVQSCAGTGGKGPKTQETPAAEQVPVTPPVAPVVAPPTTPQVPVSPPRPQQPSNQLHVAILVPMTGPSARVGQSIANAANMALLELNSPRIKLKIYNTDGGAQSAAAEAVAEGSKVILGPLFAAEVRSVQAVARAANVPVITFSNDASVAQAGTFVLGYQPGQEISRVLGYAKSRGITRFGALVPQGRYGEVATRAMSAAAAGVGQVTAMETYPREVKSLFAPARRVTNYEARLTAARSVAKTATPTNSTSVRLPPPPFDALLLADNGGMLRALLPVLRSFGVESPRVRILGTGLWAAEPDLIREPGLAGAWFASVPDGEFNSMAKRFRGQFGFQPPRLASLGYDGVLLIATGARNWSPGQSFPASSLMSSSGFVGVDGIFRFGSSGVAVRGLEVQEIVAGGGIRTVSPAPSAFR